MPYASSSMPSASATCRALSILAACCNWRSAAMRCSLEISGMQLVLLDGVERVRRIEIADAILRCLRRFARGVDTLDAGVPRFAVLVLLARIATGVPDIVKD